MSHNTIFLGCFLSLILIAESLGGYDERSSQPTTAISAYADFCQSHLRVLQAEARWESWKEELTKELYRSGNKTWIDYQRQRILAQSFELRTSAFEKYNKTIWLLLQKTRELDPKLRAHVHSFQPVKRFFAPQSIRCLASIPVGREFDDQRYSTALSNLQSETQDIQLEFKRLAQLIEQSGLKGRLREKLSFKYQLSTALLEQSQAKRRLFECYDNPQYVALNKQDALLTSNSIREGLEQSKLQPAILKIAEWEAMDSPAVDLIDQCIDKESQRLKAIINLDGNFANRKSIVRKLKSKISSLKNDRSKLVAIDARQRKDHEVLTARFDQTSQPETILDPPSNLYYHPMYIQYWVTLNKRQMDIEYHLQLHQLESELIEKILERLPAAAENSLTEPLSERGSLGWKQRLSGLYIRNLEYQLQLLNLERNRFYYQVKSGKSDSLLLSLQQNALLVSMLAIKQPGNHLQTQVHYLEPSLNEYLESVPNKELVVVTEDALPTQFFEEKDTYESTQLSLAHSRPRVYFPNRLESPLASEPNRQGRSTVAPSLYNSPYSTDVYRENQIQRRRVTTRAYPNGNLRPELKSSRRYGQVPFYLPGSTFNFGNSRWGSVERVEATDLKSRNFAFPDQPRK